MTIPTTIAIDGPAASGKSTLGRRLADHLGYLYFDTGVMYRAVTLAAGRKDVAYDDEPAISALAGEIQLDVRREPDDLEGPGYRVWLDEQNVTLTIRQPKVDANVSQVSAYAGVRQAMTAVQRQIGQRGQVVMVGRDIGTVVLPEAELKIYLDASVGERARRRYEESLGRGEDCHYDHILAAMRYRDAFDSSRPLAPLRPAEDAIILNSDHLSIEEMVAAAKDLVEGQT